MATALGMDSIGVATGGHTPDRILGAGALTVLDSVRALPDWLLARA